jgi:hypothetical protein
LHNSADFSALKQPAMSSSKNRRARPQRVRAHSQTLASCEQRIIYKMNVENSEPKISLLRSTEDFSAFGFEPSEALAQTHLAAAFQDEIENALCL